VHDLPWLGVDAGIVLARLQAREQPVAQDPVAIETPDDKTARSFGRSRPDAAKARGK
jgi:hypothetical protein